MASALFTYTPCPRPFLYDCKCPRYRHVLQTPSLTYYPVSGLLVVKGRLYIITRPCERGVHFMLRLLESVEFGRYEILATVQFYQYRFERMLSAACHNPNGTTEIFGLRLLVSHNGLPVLVHVKRLQRWARHHVPARAQARRLALAMALHARLGRGAAIGGLGPDALALVGWG